MATQDKKELPACPVETTLMLIGNKWKVLILRDLMPGTKRFGELQRSVGHVSQKVLTAQSAGDGGPGACAAHRLPRGAAPDGIQPDHPWPQPQTHPGCDGRLG